MKILYAGDSSVPGAANYLLGVLNLLNASVCHVPPSKILKPQILTKRFDAIILSDFPRANLPVTSERGIAEQVSRGAGLLMVGGWSSYQGRYGKWRGSKIEKILPVACLKKDDRRNIANGLSIIRKAPHPILDGTAFVQVPVLCGLNEVRVKKCGKIILAAREIIGAPRRLSLGTKEYPLLIVDWDPKRRIAAFTTDFAPHWCGGFVDWGKHRKKLTVRRAIHIEVGHLYIRFASNLIKWLAGTVSRNGF